MRLNLLFVYCLFVYVAVDMGPAFGVEPWPLKSAAWQSEYAGPDATGSQVLGLWQFAADKPEADSSGHGHTARLEGAKTNAAGRFGGCLECFPGPPQGEDKRHAAVVPANSALSPSGAFTLELWLKPKAEFKDTRNVFLIDKKYAGHSDYQLLLMSQQAGVRKQLQLVLGFGEDSAAFYSDVAAFEPDMWHHVAAVYDGQGGVRFFCDGQFLGGGQAPGRNGIAAGELPLSIGDRVGSTHGGFPGFIDQVRLSRGSLEFRPLRAEVAWKRRVYVRQEKTPPVSIAIRNLRPDRAKDVAVAVSLDGLNERRFELAEIDREQVGTLTYPLDTSLRPGNYALKVRVESAGNPDWRDTDSFPITIVPRPLARRMPVVMWGGIGIGEMDRLKSLGFTHFLGLSVDYAKIWDARQPTLSGTPSSIEAQWKLLDEALTRDLGVIANLSPGGWASAHQPRFQRVDAQGKPYKDPSIDGLYPEVVQFCENVGASVARDFGDHPALRAALIDSETRDHTELSFAEIDRDAYRKFAGVDPPSQARSKRGVSYTTLKDFPADRVVADDAPLVRFYRWFWAGGDGWPGLNTATHRGLKSTGRSDLWTFFDPAVRVPSVWGSGGGVDVLSHWTYSYPDPLRIAMPTDELFAMTEGRPGQQVMKMTQIIWYRSQTAPAKPDAAASPASPWEDHDPDAAYITIAPLHLREAFWTKLSRPIQGIMYHGWQSLVATDSPSAYRYTNPQTQHELKRLVKEVVEPLGPTLLQVPGKQGDVAFLESFTSQMLAQRGAYGWSGGWGADAYLILHYAGLQPEVVYEETIQRRGLAGYRVLVLADCDVLPRGVVEKIKAFQKGGGLVIGDDHLAPAIKPDLTLAAYQRTKKAAADKNALLERAAQLREGLAKRYAGALQSSNPEVVPHLRRTDGADYVFVVNDRREYGSYVGQHGLVMENGLPADAELTLRRKSGFVYDLVAGRQVAAQAKANQLRFSVQLGPCDGRVFLVSDRAIAAVKIAGPRNAKPGGSWAATITIEDAENRPISAVVPLRVNVFDPEGRTAEFSGYYGAANGRLELRLDLAANDVPGLWEVRVRELASGKSASGYFRL